MIIIIVLDSFESEQLSNGSLDKETSPDGSSFNSLLSDDGAMSDRIVNYAPNPSIPFRDLPLLVFPSSKVEVSSLNQEEAPPFIIIYRPAFGQNPSDTEIRVHLKLMTDFAIMDRLGMLAINWDDEVF